MPASAGKEVVNDEPRARAAACTHCGLPVPAGRFEPERDHQFCCPGCAAVYEAIHQCGLDRYYALRESASGTAQPALVTGKGYEAWDDPAFRSLYAQSLGEELSRIELYLEGVHCSACVWLIERLPHLLSGVVEVRLDIGRRVATVVWDHRRVHLSRIARQLDGFGYPPHPCRGRTMREARRAEDRAALIRIAVAGAIAANVMVVAFALYGGMFHGIERPYFLLFRSASLALTLISVCWPGAVFFRSAWAALRTGTVSMDVPIALGIAAGFLFSAVNTVRGSGEVYFDSIAVLIFLLLSGRWIQLRQQRAGFDAVEMLFALAPSTARLVEGDVVREVPLEALTAGERVEVRGGDSVPVDGEVIEGASNLDLSLLTGESRPVAVGAGDLVHAGTVNLGARLLVRVNSTGEETRVGRLMRLVERCAAERAPIVQLADRVAGYFVIAVLLLAAVTAAFWWPRGHERALSNALSLLIVTCPCALGLATPLAIMAGIGRATRRGILIKGGETVERLSRPGLLIMDKTGTLTQGRMSLVEWHGAEGVKPLVAALETNSAHPVARAFVEALASDHALPEARQVQVGGSGVAGLVGETRLLVGSRAYLTQHQIDVPRWASDIESALVRAAHTPVFVAADEQVEAVAGFGDPLEPDAASSIAVLRQLGWTVSVLSGDHPEVVKAVARQLGIAEKDWRGGVTPEEKHELVRSEARRRPVMMVGDGVNDAAALAAATVGVAVRGGAEASLSAADVFLTAPGLKPLVELVQGGHRVMVVIRRNLLISLAYNAIGASLAVTGMINPLIAAVLMPLSSLTVMTLSFRSRTFG